MTTAISQISTALIIGGSHGLGLSFAKRLQKLGKKVIITGRPNSKNLEELHDSGLLVDTLDISDLESLPSSLSSIFEKYPPINTIWINAGVSNWCNLTKLDSTTDQDLISTFNINSIAPMIITRYAIDKFQRENQPSLILLTSAGLGFVPNAMAPIYCASKAATHSFVVSARQALKDDQDISIIEIVPPMVAGVGLAAAAKNPRGNADAMELEDYLDATFGQLETSPAKKLKEIAGGTAQARVDAWRSGPGKLMMDMGLDD